MSTIDPMMYQQGGNNPGAPLDHHSRVDGWVSQSMIHDPFIENAPRSGPPPFPAVPSTLSRSDEPMPDYSNTSRRNATNNFGLRHRVPDIPSSLEPAYESMLQMDESPEHMKGTFAPANTRVSSAANTPFVLPRPSVAAEARNASYIERAPSVSIAGKETAKRDVSDTTMQSQFTVRI